MALTSLPRIPNALQNAWAVWSCSSGPSSRRRSCEQSASVATDFSEAINSCSLLSDRDPKKGASDVHQKKRSVLPLRILCQRYAVCREFQRKERQQNRRQQKRSNRIRVPGTSQG